MTRMTSTLFCALAYVRDAGGNITLADFLNKHTPIGKNPFFDLQCPTQLVAIDTTKAGIDALVKGE